MRRAFTWVELLVILLVLLVAVLLAMPVFLHVREASWRARCLSHLRTLSTALDAYATDHSGTLPLSMPADDERWYPNREATVPAESAPDSIYWANALSLDFEVLSCPIVSVPVAYAYNGYLHGYRSKDIRDTGEVIAFWEGFGKHPRNVASPRLDCGDVLQPCHYKQTNLATIAEPPTRSAWTHGRGANFLFLDGHAAWRRLGETVASPTDPKQDPFHTYDASGGVDKFWIDNDGRAPLFKP